MRRGPLFSAVLLAFTCLQTYYTLRNVTSIEQISQRSYRVRVDFDEQGNDCEVIVLEPRTRLWDCGLWNNWCNVMGQWPWSWIGIVRFPAAWGAFSETLTFRY